MTLGPAPIGGTHPRRSGDGARRRRIAMRLGMSVGIVLGLAIADAPGVDAQAAGEAADVVEVVEALRPGQRIRLLAPGISIADGTVVSVTRDLLSVLEDAQQWEVTPALIESLAVRERDTRRALITGAAFGAALGFGMGYFIDKLTCEAGNECRISVVITSGVIGTLLGAGGGAALGYRSIHWTQRYP